MRNRLKGAAAGLLGGLAASAVMLGFQRIWSAAAEKAGRPDLKPGATFDRLPHARHQRAGETRPNSSEAAAQKLARVATGLTLGPRNERLGGLLGHFAYGGAMGALYGAFLEGARRSPRSGGVAFGLGVFLFDQFFLPAAGLSERPQHIPASTQAFGAANHVIYGAATEAVRSKLRRTA